MNIRGRLKRLEEALEHLNNPTQEDRVREYLGHLKAYFKGEGTAENALSSFDEVIENRNNRVEKRRRFR